MSALHEETYVAPEAEEAVRLPRGVVAPQVAVWNRLSTATQPFVEAGQSDPRDAGETFAWCTGCAGTAAGEVAHPATAERPFHVSEPVTVPLRLNGEAVRHSDGIALPALVVDVRANGFHQRPQLLVGLSMFDGGKERVLATPTLVEVRQLIRALTAAVDVMTGLDDFDTHPAPTLAEVSA